MDSPPMLPTLAGSVLVWLGLWASLAYWSVVVAQWLRGEPTPTLAPRRPVPWRGLDLLLILAVWFFGLAVVEQLAYRVLGPELLAPPAVDAAAQETAVHDVLRLVAEGGPWVVALGVFAAALLAPVFEEILFRLLLQGWLESLDRRLRRHVPWLARSVRWGTWPVVLVAVLFAAIHFRFPSIPREPKVVAFLLAGESASRLVTLVFALVWVRMVRGATLADLGIVPRKIPADVGWGLLLFFAGIATPLYVAQVVLMQWAGGRFSPDALTLFPFALVLGVLYCRTHRLVPSITVHFALNASSLTAVWLATR